MIFGRQIIWAPHGRLSETRGVYSGEIIVVVAVGIGYCDGGGGGVVLLLDFFFGLCVYRTYR